MSPISAISSTDRAVVDPVSCRNRARQQAGADRFVCLDPRPQLRNAHRTLRVWLAAPKNFAALADLSGQRIDLVHGRRPPRGIVLDMDLSVSPTTASRRWDVWNGHYARTCYHPLFVFNQFSDLNAVLCVPATCTALTAGTTCSSPAWRTTRAKSHASIFEQTRPPLQWPRSTSFHRWRALRPRERARASERVSGHGSRSQYGRARPRAQRRTRHFPRFPRDGRPIACLANAAACLCLMISRRLMPPGPIQPHAWAIGQRGCCSGCQENANVLTGTRQFQRR